MKAKYLLIQVFLVLTILMQFGLSGTEETTTQIYEFTTERVIEENFDEDLDTSEEESTEENVTESVTEGVDNITEEEEDTATTTDMILIETTTQIDEFVTEQVSQESVKEDTNENVATTQRQIGESEETTTQSTESVTEPVIQQNVNQSVVKDTIEIEGLTPEQIEKSEEILQGLAVDAANLVLKYSNLDTEVNKLRENPPAFPNITNLINANSDVIALAAALDQTGSMEKRERCKKIFDENIEAIVGSLYPLMEKNRNKDLSHITKEKFEMKVLMKYVILTLNKSRRVYLKACALDKKPCRRFKSYVQLAKDNYELFQSQLDNQDENSRSFLKIRIAKEIEVSLKPAVDTCLNEPAAVL